MLPGEAVSICVSAPDEFVNIWHAHTVTRNSPRVGVTACLEKLHTCCTHDECCKEEPQGLCAREHALDRPPSLHR